MTHAAGRALERPGRHAAQEGGSGGGIACRAPAHTGRRTPAIALELHNSTAQPLLAMSLNLANLKTHIAAEPATLQLFGEIIGSLQETTKEVRTFTYLLNPPHLESDGPAALRRRLQPAYRLKTSLRVSLSTDALPLPLQRSLLRIVQEALTNVHRHAAATRVSIDLRSIGKQTHLLIRDQWPRRRDRQGEWRPARRAAPPRCRHPRNERKNATAWRQTGHPLEPQGHHRACRHAGPIRVLPPK